MRLQRVGQSGTLILIAKSSILGKRTANKLHQAGGLGYPSPKRSKGVVGTF